jgi:hypothetical protein
MLLVTTSPPMPGVAPTVVRVQFFGGQGPVHLRVIRFFLCQLSFHQSCIYVHLWSAGCTKRRLEATISLLPRNELIVSKKQKSCPITGLDRPLGLPEVVAPRISRQSAHDSKKKPYLEFVTLGEICTDLHSGPHRFVYFSVVCHIYLSLFTLVPPGNCCGCVLK